MQIWGLSPPLPPGLLNLETAFLKAPNPDGPLGLQRSEGRGQGAVQTLGSVRVPIPLECPQLSLTVDSPGSS